MVRIYLILMTLLLMCSCGKPQSGLEPVDNNEKAGGRPAGKTGFLLCQPPHHLYGNPGVPIRFNPQQDTGVVSVEKKMSARSHKSLIRWSEYSSFYSDMSENK